MLNQALFFLFLCRAGLDKALAALSIPIGGMTAGALVNFIVLGISGYLALTRRLNYQAVMIWVPFLSIAGLSVGWSPFKAEAIRSWVVLLTYFAEFLIPFLFVNSVYKYEKILRLIIYSSFAPVLYAAVQIFFVSGPSSRIASTFLHPNIFAYYLNIIIAVLFIKKMTIVSRGQSRMVNFHSFYIIILIVLELFTQSRGGWIGLIIVLTAIATMIDRRLLAGLLLLPSLILVPSVGNRLADLGQGTEVSSIVGAEGINSFAWRKLMWQSALDDIADDPITGRGLASYGANALRFFPLVNPEDYSNPKGIGAHNTYVQILYETGIFGALAYIYLQIAMLIKTIGCMKYDRRGSIIISCLIIANMIYNYADNMLEYGVYNLYFYCTIGIFLARWQNPQRFVPQTPKKVRHPSSDSLANVRSRR